MIDSIFLYFFFFNDTSPTEIYTLSLHDALPIYGSDKTLQVGYANHFYRSAHKFDWRIQPAEDRKSGSAGMPRPISYAVFCLKKKKLIEQQAYLRHGDYNGRTVAIVADLLVQPCQ